MRKLQTMAALILMTLPAYLVAQDARFSIEPQFPQQGQKVQVSFNPAGTAADTAKSISLAIYWYDTKLMRVDEVPMTKLGNNFIASYTFDKTATAAAFTFIAGDKKESNDRKGYIVQLYDDKKQPVAFSNKAVYRFYTEYDGQNAGIDNDVQFAAPFMEKEYQTFPANRRENFKEYFAALKNANKDGRNDIISAELPLIETDPNLTEDDYNVLLYWYRELKQPQKADALQAAIKTKFPQGKWKFAEFRRVLYAEKNAAKRDSMLQAYTKDNPVDPGSLSNAKWMVAEAYAEEKNWEKFNATIKNMEPAMRAIQMSSLAHEMAEKNENLDIAKKMAKEALEYGKKELENPANPKPPAQTIQEWNKMRKWRYASQLQSYAKVLGKMGDEKMAFALMKQVVDYRERKLAGANEEYVLLLEKMASPKQVKIEVENFIKDGAAGPFTREVLKRNYIKLNKSAEGFDEYLEKLDAVNIQKIRERLKHEMIAKGAPSFKLVNMDGVEVDFASLRGKVVVLDFWATWCGPCIASFPAMQKMVEKYKEKDVVFLFINTWENVPDRQKLVTDFIAKHKYKFNVLYDKQSQPDSNDFTVVKDYEIQGIPTKFIVDRNGQIRFIDMGWSGNEVTFIQELQLMIEMAAEAGGSGAGDKKSF